MEKQPEPCHPCIDWNRAAVAGFENETGTWRATDPNNGGGHCLLHATARSVTGVTFICEKQTGRSIWEHAAPPRLDKQDETLSAIKRAKAAVRNDLLAPILGLVISITFFCDPGTGRRCSPTLS